jgi:hypothetical protein
MNLHIEAILYWMADSLESCKDIKCIFVLNRYNRINNPVRGAQVATLQTVFQSFVLSFGLYSYAPISMPMKTGLLTLPP